MHTDANLHGAIRVGNLVVTEAFAQVGIASSHCALQYIYATNDSSAALTHL